MAAGRTDSCSSVAIRRVVRGVPELRVCVCKKPCPNAGINVAADSRRREIKPPLFRCSSMGLSFQVRNRPVPLGSKLHPEPSKRPWMVMVHMTNFRLLHFRHSPDRRSRQEIGGFALRIRYGYIEALATVLRSLLWRGKPSP
jgi:hypothetical protein